MRRALPGSIACGRSRIRDSSSAYAAARPSGVVTSASNSARTARSSGGNVSGSTTACRYRPVPPTSSARLPRASMSAITARACGLEARHRPVFRRVGDVDQVVRDDRPLGGRGLGGADVEPAVHLHRVDRDDLDVTEGVRGGEREIGLAGRGRTDECEVRHAGAAVTGMDARTRGASARSRSPRRQWGAAA